MHLAEQVSNCNSIVKPVTNIDTLFKRWLSRGQNIFISRARRTFSWQVLNELTVATVSGQHEYTLSPLTDLGKIIVLTRRGDTKRKITMISREQFQELVPDPTETDGIPEFAYHSGFSPVQNQPSAASVLTAVSSSASDTLTLLVEGLDASGVLVRDEIVLTGTSPSQSSVAFERVLNLAFNGDLVGVVTLTSNSGAVTNAVIGQRMRQISYPKFIFYPRPNTAETWYYDAHIHFPDLVADADFSLIPSRYHDAIEAFACYWGFLHKEDKQAAAIQAQYFDTRVQDAVNDDTGPYKRTVMEDFQAELWAPPEGRLPGLFPRGY